MASFVTNSGADGLQSGGTITWASDAIKARLVASSATPTKDDTAMTGLTAIGTDQTLASKTKTKDTANDRIVYYELGGSSHHARGWFGSTNWFICQSSVVLSGHQPDGGWFAPSLERRGACDDLDCGGGIAGQGSDVAIVCHCSGDAQRTLGQAGHARRAVS